MSIDAARLRYEFEQIRRQGLFGEFRPFPAWWTLPEEERAAWAQHAEDVFAKKGKGKGERP